MDGSAEMFMGEISRVGTDEQKGKRKFYKFRKNISFEDSEKEIEMLGIPARNDEFKITVMVDYNSPILGTQHARLEDLSDFTKDIAPCRTFVFMKELATLAEHGLIKGGDINNAVVLAERPYSKEEITEIGRKIGRTELRVKHDTIGVVSNSGLKFQNEPARHKLLDIL